MLSTSTARHHLTTGLTTRVSSCIQHPLVGREVSHVEHAQGRNKPGRQPSSCQGFLSNPSSTHEKLSILTSLLSWPQVPLWLLSLASGLNHVIVDEGPLAPGPGGSFAARAAVGELRLNKCSQHTPQVQPWDCPKKVLPPAWGTQW